MCVMPIHKRYRTEVRPSDRDAHRHPLVESVEGIACFPRELDTPKFQGLPIIRFCDDKYQS